MNGAPLATGIHRVTPDAYHADTIRPEPTLSRSVASLLITNSPRHAWTAHPRLNPAYEAKTSAVFDIGRAAHRAVLGVGHDYVAYPPELLSSDGGARSNAAKEWAQEQCDAGRVPLKADQVYAVGAMTDAVRAQLSVMGIALDPSRSELTAVAEVDGVWCRAMVDNAPVDPRLPLYDIKTTTDASPEAVIRSIQSYGYDFQAAFYLDAWRAATGEARRMRFIMVEKAAPYGVTVVQLHDDPNDAADWMQTAFSKAREARRMWAECSAANIWPGYPLQVLSLGAPTWHNQKWADRSTGNPIVTPEALRAAAAFQSPEGFAP